MLARTPLKDQMIAWLETRESAEEYEYTAEEDCACGQFARYVGQSLEWRLRAILESSGDWKHLDLLACARPRTFGALLERLRNG